MWTVTSEPPSIKNRPSNRCSDDSKKEEFWAKTYVSLIEAHPDLAVMDKVVKVCKVETLVFTFNNVSRELFISI